MIPGSGSDGHSETVPLALGVIVPLREIHKCAPLFHVAVNLPGNRRDIRVPWPNSSVGMAILTGTLQNGANRRGDVSAGEKRCLSERLVSGTVGSCRC
jgi:hypothetical protein